MSEPAECPANIPSHTLPAGEQKDGLCGICPAGCWVRTTLENGRLKKVVPLPDHPLGMICTNGAHSPEIVHDPRRLRRPLRRTGPKGSYQFEPITWDQAFETIVSRLQAVKAESGPEATAIYTGRGSFELSLCDIFQPAGVAISSASSVLFPFGSPNTLGVGALCYVSFAMIAPHVTFGEMYHTMDSDIDHAELIVVWGANPATDSPPLAHEQIRRARARGAEVVVIDPRRSETALEVDAEWIPIRPGTDGALALGLINVLVSEELFDEEFVEGWTVGWPQLESYVQHFRPETVESITGVPAPKVISLARRLARARGACPVMYTGLEYSDSGVQAIRAVFTLWAAAGQLDVPGGLLIRMHENRFPINRKGLVPNPDVKKALGRERFPVYSMYRGESHAICLPESILEGRPYRIRALMVLGGSICTAWPDPGLWRRTLAGLDFLVCIDRHLTADAAYADIVLPATTGYEITSYMVYGPLFKIREKLVEPVGEARDDFHILAELARRLGYGDLYPQESAGINGDDEARLRHVLEGSGFTLEQVRAAGGEVRIPVGMMEYKKWEKGRLRPDGRPGFNTPTAKFEIASSILEEHGYDPLPVYTEPREGPLARPDLARRYPLVFNSGARIFHDFRSQHHGVTGLRHKAPEPLVTINDQDAAARGILDGQWVWLETARARLRYRARVTADIVRGAIEANMGGGGPLGTRAWQECNVNELTDLAHYDPISGFPVYKALLCEVVPAESVEDDDEENAVSKDAEHRQGAAIGPGTGSHTRAAARDAHPETAERARPARQVYLDNNATTRVHPRVLQAMKPFLGSANGNPSSIHTRGTAARDAVEAARRKVARTLECTARRIVFTGGGSEADNLAIKGAALARQDQGRHIIATAIEHPAVLQACRGLERLGFQTTVLEVDHRGRVDPVDLEAAMRPETILVSVMAANNEIGTLQPIAAMAAIAHRHGALFHSDAVQALGKVALDVDELDVDLLAVSAHKLHGPKGVGALYVRKGVSLVPLIDGGGQEHRLRAGTENVAGIVGFGEACDITLRALHAGEMERLACLRDRLADGIVRLVPGARLNGDPDLRLPNTLNMTLPGMRGESLVLFLDRHGVCFSSGSACKSGNPAPSHVLLAIGLSEAQAHCSVRFSLSWEITGEEIDYTLEALEKVLEESRSSVRFASCR